VFGPIPAPHLSQSGHCWQTKASSASNISERQT
jgi:hypothetical protein